MTTELVRADEDLLAALPYPKDDSGYVEASSKLERLETELADLESEIANAQQELDEFHVDDSDSAEDAAKLGQQIDLLTRKAGNLRAVIETQRENVQQELARAKRVFHSAAKQTWVDEYIPEIVSLIDRLLELQNVYAKLKRSGGGVLNPPYPHALTRALGKNDVWLKKRKEEWFADTGGE